MGLETSNSKPFLLHVAEYLQQTYGEKIGDIKVVLPNRRAALFLKQHIAQLNSKPIWAPTIISIEELVNELANVSVLNTLDLLFEFYDVYQQNEKEPDSFDRFSEWAGVLLSDFNEIDRQLADTDSLFTYINEAYAYKVWNTTGNELSEFQKNYIDFWGSLKHHYNRLKKHLLSKKMAWQGLAFRLAYENLTKATTTNNSTIVFAGFNALTKAEEEIFDLLSNRNVAEFLWDADVYYLNNKSQEAGIFLQKNKHKSFMKPMHWEFDELDSQEKNIEVHGIAGDVLQCKLAGSILKENIAANDMHKTAVILADEELLVPLLSSFPNKVEKVNVTMGYPLKLTAIHGLFTLLLNLYENQEKNERGYYFKHLLPILQHPYITALANFDLVKKKINKNNQVFILSSELTNSQSENQELTNLLFQSNINTLKAIEILESLLLLLKTHFEEQQSNSIELEYLYKYYTVIKSVKDYLQKVDSIGFAGLKVIFSRLIANESVDFYGEPLEGLQVMGMLETRNLDFENIILLSANEGTLPKNKAGNSFIPFEMQKHFGIHTQQDKNAVFAYHFYRLIQRTKNAYLLYSTETDYLKSGEKSRFITQMQRELKNVSIKDRITTISVQGDELERLSVHKTEEVVNDIWAYFKNGVSASSLNTFINCPLDFYYKYIIGLREDNEVEETIEASTMGSAVHEVLEKLYQKHEGEIINQAHIELMIPQVEKIAMSYFEEYFGNTGSKTGKNFLALQVVIKLVNDFLKQEIKCLKKHNELQIIKCEVNLEAEFKINGQSIKIKGSIDRIDKVDGVIRIIDYKTGSVDKSDLKVDPETVFTDYKYGKAVQLLIYQYLYLSNNPNTNPVDVLPSIISLKQLSKDNLPLQENHSWSIPKIEEFITEIINKIIDSSESFTHNNKAKYCIACSS